MKKPPGELNATQRAQLEAQGCRAARWRDVLIDPRTDLSLITETHFLGPVTIGHLSRKATLSFRDMEPRPPGLHRVRLDRVSIGEGTRLEEIGETVRNLDVGPGSLILRVEEITCDLQSSFGHGAKLAVLNENGRRTCHLRSDLSTQWAHLEVFHKQDVPLQARMSRLSGKRAESLQGKRGRIGAEVLIRSCGRLRNLRVDDRARIVGAALLEDGTVCECAHVEGPVTARQFVLGRAAHLDGASHIERAYLGEGTETGKGAVVTDTVIFSDSQFHGGEAVSAWCGVHTISHHKSTLLIAGAWQFYNAGSGANFSNHHYRLGPVHQGLLERGCKSGSSSFLLFPSHIGAFSTLIGRHGKSLESADFPFSLLIGKGERTRLYPGFLCFSSGQYRDEKKWPLRDRRPPGPQDHFMVRRLSPYTVDRALRGMDLLRPLQDHPERDGGIIDTVELRGMHVPRAHLGSALKAYELLLRGWVYLALLDRYDRAPWNARTHPFRNPAARRLREPWVDWAGVLCPRSQMEKAVSRIRDGRLETPAALGELVQGIMSRFEGDEWQWITKHVGDLLPRDCVESPRRLSEDMVSTLDAWYAKYLDDGVKEFSPSAQTGYGMDGEVSGDFLAVRGTPESDATLQTLHQDRRRNVGRARKLARILGRF